MCGITGFLAPDGFGAAGLEYATGMTRTLAHRGPDREAVWADPAAGIALGHRRLAVVDLSDAGNQPMISEHGRYVTVFNGEIYNFQELRRELEASVTPRFRGDSDTEVMLACFERYGVRGALPRFNGMFAFAVWDRVERNLYLARDPLGEKPLYYGWAGDAFLFGSELKALRAHPAFRPEIDRSAIAMLLGYGYVPAPHSIYRNTSKLPPGSMLKLGWKSRIVEMHSHWSFNAVAERGRANLFPGSDHEALCRLETLLADAVKLRTIADVPLGAFLSGGIDSSLVVALMQSQSARPVKTFTIGFHESEYNEARDAKAVARHLHTDHTEWYVTPREAIDVVPKLPELYDEPFADSSQIPTYLVSSLARRQVTVSLSGDGGDELFGGYTRYRRMLRLRSRMRLLPGLLRRRLARVAGAVPAEGRWRRLQKFGAVAADPDPIAMYLACVRLWHGGDPLVRGVALPEPHDLDWPRCEDALHQFMAVDTVSYLPGDILVKVDRAAMGVSLESRIPLLDPRVVEFAWTLPRRVKVRGDETKWILRQILDKHVPRALVDRPKSGFGIPLAEWLRGPLRAWAEALLEPGRLRREGYLEVEPIKRRWRQHLEKTEDHSPVLWSVLMFQAWLETAGAKPARAPAMFAGAAKTI